MSRVESAPSLTGPPPSGALLAAILAAVLGAAVWAGRPFLPARAAVALPELPGVSARALVSLADLAAALGANPRSVAAGSGALASGCLAFLLAETGAGAASGLLAASALALTPASGQPIGALLCAIWLAAARLRRRPARWRASAIGCALAGVALLDVAALLLLPALLLHVRDAYPRKVRLLPAALLGGFGVGGYAVLAGLALQLRDVDRVDARVRRVAALAPGGALERFAEAFVPESTVRAAGALVRGGAAAAPALLALVAAVAAVAALALGWQGLARAWRTLWAPRRGTAFAAFAVVAFAGAGALVQPGAEPFSWTPALAGLLWLWGVGLAGVGRESTRSVVGLVLPLGLAGAQLLAAL